MQVTKEVNEVIVGAIEYARENKHEYVTAEHILYKCTFIEKVQMPWKSVVQILKI